MNLTKVNGCYSKELRENCSIRNGPSKSSWKRLKRDTNLLNFLFTMLNKHDIIFIERKERKTK